MKRNQLFHRFVTAFVLLIMAATFTLYGFALFNSDSSYQFGINGMTEKRCTDGLEFIVGQNGHVTQVIGADGKPVRCN